MYAYVYLALIFFIGAMLAYRRYKVLIVFLLVVGSIPVSVALTHSKTIFSGELWFLLLGGVIAAQMGYVAAIILMASKQSWSNTVLRVLGFSIR